MQVKHVISLLDDDPQSIDVVLKYLYTGDPQTVANNISLFSDPIQTLVRLAITANKYVLPNLVELTRHELLAFGEKTRNGWFQGTILNLAKDSLRALGLLRHFEDSKKLLGVQQAVTIVLRETRQLATMNDELCAVFDELITEDKDAWKVLIKFGYGGAVTS